MWYKKYLGLKWTDDYDCFDFFCEVQSEEFGVEGLRLIKGVPNYENRRKALDFIDKSDDLNKNWEKVLIPQEGDAAIFGSKGVSFHIGIYVKIDNQGGVIHNQKDHGVVFTPLRTIKVMGMNIKMFLRHIK